MAIDREATRAYVEQAGGDELLVFENWAGSVSLGGIYSEQAFAPRLHEEGRWDEEAYWRFDRALFRIGAKYGDDPLPKILGNALFDLHSYISGRLAWHRMPSDLSQIEEFSDQDCHDWAERIESAFRAAVTGICVANRHHEKVNPLFD